MLCELIPETSLGLQCVNTLCQQMQRTSNCSSIELFSSLSIDENVNLSTNLCSRFRSCQEEKKVCVEKKNDDIDSPSHRMFYYRFFFKTNGF